jgi:hypothetical protein
VAEDAFCAFVLEIFTLGITTGTTATTYDPASSVTRLQMAAFLSRTVDGVLKREPPGGARSVLDPKKRHGARAPRQSVRRRLSCVPTARTSGRRTRRHGLAGPRERGRLLETWTGAASVYAVLSRWKVFAAGGSPGVLYRIDPRSQPAR